MTRAIRPRHGLGGSISGGSSGVTARSRGMKLRGTLVRPLRCSVSRPTITSSRYSKGRFLVSRSRCAFSATRTAHRISRLASAIITSPMARCVVTAQIVKRARNEQLTHIHALDQRNRDAEGRLGKRVGFDPHASGGAVDGIDGADLLAFGRGDPRPYGDARPTVVGEHPVRV